MVTKASIQDAKKIKPEELIEALDGLPTENAHCAELAVRTLQAAIGNHLQAPGDLAVSP